MGTVMKQSSVQVDTSDEDVILKKERKVKETVESITLTKTRVILSSTHQWCCGCIVKKQDRSYWLDDVTNVALDTSPFKKVWFFLGLLCLILFVVLLAIAGDLCSTAGSSSGSNNASNASTLLAFDASAVEISPTPTLLDSSIANAAIEQCKKQFQYAGYGCLGAGLVFWIVCYIKYRCSMATIYFTVKAGVDLGSWWGMPAGAASSTASESFDLTLIPAREFHKAFLLEVTKTKKFQ